MGSVREQLKRAARGRGQDAQGRSKRGPPFVQLFHWFQDTQAWRSLGPAPRSVYIELARRYNGRNNGEISLSVRQAANLVRISKDTASKCFHELEAKGLIRRNRCGSFNWKLKHATTWVLTEHPFRDSLPTRDFARWKPEKENAGPNQGTNCPKQGTDLSNPRTPLATKRPWLGTGGLVVHGPTVPNRGTHIIYHER